MILINFLLVRISVVKMVIFCFLCYNLYVYIDEFFNMMYFGLDCGRWLMEDVINLRWKWDISERMVEDWWFFLKIFGGLNVDYGMFFW